MTAPVIILTMIVRDEAHIIRRCITAAAPLVDAVYIHDTGSVDGTEIVAKHTCQKLGLPCTVESRRWTDFASNRNACIAEAEAKYEGQPAYALMIDADEVLEIEEPATAKPLMLTADVCEIQSIMGGVAWWRPQLFRLGAGFRFKGVVHEFLEAPKDATRGRLLGVTNRPHQDSARNRMGHEKFVLDALTMRGALEKETDPHMKARYTFYLAQCYRDAGDFERARGWYETRATMGGWPQEVYCALLYAGRIAERQGNTSEAQEMFERARAMGLRRHEAYYHAIRHHRVTGSEEFARVLLAQALAITPDEGGLFLERWATDVGLPAEKQLLMPGAADGVAA